MAALDAVVTRIVDDAAFRADVVAGAELKDLGTFTEAELVALTELRDQLRAHGGRLPTASIGPMSFWM